MASNPNALHRATAEKRDYWSAYNTHIVLLVFFPLEQLGHLPTHPALAVLCCTYKQHFRGSLSDEPTASATFSHPIASSSSPATDAPLSCQTERDAGLSM